MPIERVASVVTFSTKDNFRTESVVIDVADFELPNNGILGRPTLAKFMAAAHYAFLMLKIPGSTGPISVSADVQSSQACAEKLYWAAVAVEDDNEDRPVREPSVPRKTRVSTDDVIPVEGSARR